MAVYCNLRSFIFMLMFYGIHCMGEYQIRIVYNMVQFHVHVHTCNMHFSHVVYNITVCYMWCWDVCYKDKHMEKSSSTHVNMLWLYQSYQCYSVITFFSKKHFDEVHKYLCMMSQWKVTQDREFPSCLYS